jgi:hypothetical protein
VRENCRRSSGWPDGAVEFGSSIRRTGLSPGEAWAGPWSLDGGISCDEKSVARYGPPVSQSVWTDDVRRAIGEVLRTPPYEDQQKAPGSLQARQEGRDHEGDAARGVKLSRVTVRKIIAGRRIAA